MQVNLSGHLRIIYCGCLRIDVQICMLEWIACIQSHFILITTRITTRSTTCQYLMHSHTDNQEFLCQLLLSDLTVVCQLPPGWSSRATLRHPLANHFSQAAEKKQRVKIHYTINIKWDKCTSSDKGSYNDIQPLFDGHDYLSNSRCCISEHNCTACFENHEKKIHKKILLRHVRLATGVLVWLCIIHVYENRKCN